MKKYIVEFFGTFLFVVSVIGAVFHVSLLTPLYIGIALTALVYMGGAVSGAHYNPAVTCGIWLGRKIGTRDALAYVVAQLLGAGLAFLIAEKGLHISLSPLVLPDLRAALIGEALFTCALVSVVYHTAINRLTAGNSYFGLAIGFIVTIGVVVVGKISGGFFNPAVLFGVGLFGISMKTVLALLIGQGIGVFIAAWLYRYTVGK